MPRISTFYGIVIAIYYDDHAPPPFHAIYSGEEAVISINDLELLAGGLSRRARALVLEWGSVHQKELRAVCERAARHEPLGTIDPL
jgi:Domain of unknown function (DUF4160)